MQAEASAGRRSTAWIISPLADVILLVASPLAIVPLVGVATETFSAESIFLFVASFASIGHHLPGFIRAYGDHKLFRRFRWRFLLAPPLVAVAIAFFTLKRMHGLDLVLTAWATWHILMQTYGMMRIYDLKRDVRDPLTAWLNFAVCLAIFVAGFLFSQTRVFSLLETAARVGLPLPSPTTLTVVRWALIVLCGVLLLGYAVNAVIRTRMHGFGWQKLALLFMTGWLYWSCGSLSTNLLIGVAMFEIFHAVQYDALVWSYNRRLTNVAGSGGRLLRFLFGRGWLPLVYYLAAIAAFGSVKWLAESIEPSTVKTTLLILLLTSTTLHFYFDGFIWKVSERATQQNLGIESGGRSQIYVPALIHGAKWGVVAVAALLLLWIETEDRSRSGIDNQSWIGEALTLTPDVPELLVRSGQLSFARGELTEAVNSARRAVQTQPASADGQLLLAESLAASRDFSGAREAAERAAGLDPQSANASYQVGLSSVQLHDLETAEKALLRSIALNPNLAESHFQLGNVYFLTGRAELAEQSYHRALSIAPRLPHVHANLGAVLMQLGRVAEAKQALLMALDLGDNPQCHYNLGVIFLNEGDTSLARQHLQRAESLGQSIAPGIRQAAGL